MQRDRLVAVFDAIDDPYLRSRREDVDHVIGRVQAALARDTTPAERQIASRVGTILISDTVAPAELAHLHRTRRARRGHDRRQSALAQRDPRAQHAHADDRRRARCARAKSTTTTCCCSMPARGEVIVHPTAQDLARYRSSSATRRATPNELSPCAHERTLHPRRRRDPACTRTPNCLPTSHRRAAAAPPASVCTAPNSCSCSATNCRREDEQFAAYRELVLGMGGAAGHHPHARSRRRQGRRHRPRAARGIQSRARRARRAPVDAPARDLFATQLRAILRASSLRPGARSRADGDHRRGNRRRARAHRTNARATCAPSGHEIADHFELGAMIEVPAAAIALPRHDHAARFRLDRHQRPDPIHARRRPQQRRARHRCTTRCIRPC